MKIVTKRDGMIIISGKRNSKSKIFIRDKGYYILVNGSFHQEKKTIIDIFATGIRALKYMKKLTEIRRKIYNSTIITAGFNIPLLMKKRN